MQIHGCLGTPINNIPKVHNCDLDLHRLFKVVRMFGGYNKVNPPIAGLNII